MSERIFKITCSTCLFTNEVVKIHSDGRCDMCHLHDENKKATDPSEWSAVQYAIKDAGLNKKYDCIIGISGGEDSSILLYTAVKVYGFRPLVIHFNNRWNRPEADHNIKLLTSKLNVDFIEYFVNKEEYDKVCDSFLMAGVQDADIPNDVAMAKLMYDTARKYGIKYVLNGHDYRTEGSSPRSWSIIDYNYIKSVYRAFQKQELVNYPLYTVWDQIWSGIIGIRNIRVFHYEAPNRRSVMTILKDWGWKDYGGKHNENIYTAFVGNYLLPKKFKIDKRITYLSAQIREGAITKEEAYKILETPANFDPNDLGEKRAHILKLMNESEIGSRDAYHITNFKALKPVFWVLLKLGIVSLSMYKKYCK